MGRLNREKNILGTGKPVSGTIIRRQHCICCDKVLALEITDRLGYGGTYEYINDRGIWVKGKWFGKSTRCPNCGLTGKLPKVDKPLSYESMQKKEGLKTEVQNG